LPCIAFRIPEAGLRYSRWLDRYALRRGRRRTARRVPESTVGCCAGPAR